MGNCPSSCENNAVTRWIIVDLILFLRLMGFRSNYHCQEIEVGECVNDFF